MYAGDNFSKYIGRTFVYESKYGGITYGEIFSIFTTFKVKRTEGKMFLRPKIMIMSTNKISYELEEIYIDMEIERLERD